MNAKARFQSDPQNMKRHSTLLNEPQLQVSFDAAILALTDEMQNTEDPNNFYRLQGALRLVTTFQNLAILPKDHGRQMIRNLSQNR